jgi:hypothetical protein
MGRLLRLGGLCVLALALCGCELLLPGFYGDEPFEPFDPGVTTAYESGTATLETDADGATQTIVLDELVEGSEMSGFGSTIIWRNDDGWALTLNTYDMGVPMPGGGGDIGIQRIVGNELWTTDSFTSPNSCIIDITDASEDGLTGTATCTGLRWLDGLGGSYGMGMAGPRYVEDEPAFDLTITFEAVPASGAHG